MLLESALNQKKIHQCDNGAIKYNLFILMFSKYLTQTITHKRIKASFSVRFMTFLNFS